MSIFAILSMSWIMIIESFLISEFFEIKMQLWWFVSCAYFPSIIIHNMSKKRMQNNYGVYNKKYTTEAIYILKGVWYSIFYDDHKFSMTS